MSQLQQRLSLRGQLYSQPERHVDKAAQIIEQLKSTTGKEGRGGGGGGGLRSLLVTAGQLLAADCFNMTTLHETDHTTISSDPGKSKTWYTYWYMLMLWNE